MSESAVSDKPLLFYGLARNRRSPKRPSEPRPSGVHPEEGAVGKRRRSLPLENNGFLLGLEVSTQQAHTGIRNPAAVALTTHRQSAGRSSESVGQERCRDSVA